MDYFLTAEEQALQKKVREIAEKIVLPARDEFDLSSEFPHPVIAEMAKQGLLKVVMPPEYGGISGRIIDQSIACEEVGRICGGIATAYAVNSLGLGPIVNFCSEEQKQKYLPKIATGEMQCAFGLTEAQAGSDVANIQTTARKDGDHYILNGVKQFISNASIADVYVVLAVTAKSRGARGVSAFIIEKGIPGFSFGKEEDKLGIRTSVTKELVFEDCRISKENLMGKEGLGFIYTMRNFDRARPGVGSIALGIAQGAYEAALDFTFRHDLINNQYIQRVIADIASEIEACRDLMYSVARMIG